MTERFLRLNDIVGRKATNKHPAQPGLIPIGASTLWRKVKEGRFPKPLKLGERTTVWRLSDVQAWMNNAASAA